MLKLFTTSHCHLCEEALSIVSAVVPAHQIILIEIAEDPMLMETYGLRIPVLQREDTGLELNWPFDQAMLNAFLT